MKLKNPKLKHSLLTDYQLDQTVPIVVKVTTVVNQSSKTAATEAQIAV